MVPQRRFGPPCSMVKLLLQPPRGLANRGVDPPSNRMCAWFSSNLSGQARRLEPLGIGKEYSSASLRAATKFSASFFASRVS